MADLETFVDHATRLLHSPHGPPIPMDEFHACKMDIDYEIVMEDKWEIPPGREDEVFIAVSDAMAEPAPDGGETYWDGRALRVKHGKD